MFIFNVFDLADAARSSYGSPKRILFEAAIPLSSHGVDLCYFVEVTGALWCPGVNKNLCGGLVGE